MPNAHLLIVLTVAGATIIASASGSTSRSPGFLYDATHRMPGERGQRRRVDELSAVRGHDDADVPAGRLGQPDEPVDVSGRW